GRGRGDPGIRTIAAELAHKFGIGDEYALVPQTAQVSVADLEQYSNLQLHADALGADGKLKGNEIKWNWHRIAKAAPVAGPLTAAGGAFVVPLRPPAGPPFSLT